MNGERAIPAIPFTVYRLPSPCTRHLLASPLAPPVAPRHPTTTVRHGETLPDDYAWLRQKEDPAVRAYLEAENSWADAWLAPTAAMQEQLYQEMLGRIRETDLAVPYRKGDRWYYTRTEEGKQYPIHCRRHGSPTEGEETVLVDLNLLAEGKPFMALGDLNVSPFSPQFATLLRRGGLRSAAAGHGWQPTWPSVFPPLGIQIDHALVSPEVRVMGFQRGPANGSDHRPIIVDVIIPGKDQLLSYL